MKQANTKEPEARYPDGSRLFIYERLLTVLYQQNMISKVTFTNAVKHVERTVEKRQKETKGKEVRQNDADQF